MTILVIAGLVEQVAAEAGREFGREAAFSV